MGIVTTIGLDSAKSVFRVHGVDAAGEVVIRRKLTRGRVLGFTEATVEDRGGVEAWPFDRLPGRSKERHFATFMAHLKRCRSRYGSTRPFSAPPAEQSYGKP